MLEWLKRSPGHAPFLVTEDRTWTYDETVTEVESRLSADHLVLSPSLDSESVFSIIAGLSGGGVVVLAPDQSTKYKVQSTAAAGCLVVFTSGTSGPPKGVRLTMANLEAASRASVEHLGHDANDRWLLAMPLHHVGGISILVRSAFAGASVHMLPSFDPEEVVASIAEGVTILSVVSTMLTRLLDHGIPVSSGLKAILVGGGPIPDGLLERAVEAGLPALPTYGMTETFGQVATLRPGSPIERRAHPLPGIDLRIEADGRIAVAGDQVSPGYLDEPDRVDRWFVTNDLGVIEDGSLIVLGRADSVVVSGGENINPEQVESELRTNTQAGDIVVFGIPHEDWGSVLCCLYTGPAGSTDLEMWLKNRLPGHMIPKIWKRVEEIPLTGPGKPDRRRAADLL